MKTHWLAVTGRPACGAAGNLTTVSDPARAQEVDCANCLHSWSYAVAAQGCLDESRPRPVPRKKGWTRKH
jgi:hypothetical protein